MYSCDDSWITAAFTSVILSKKHFHFFKVLYLNNEKCFCLLLLFFFQTLVSQPWNPLSVHSYISIFCLFSNCLCSSFGVCPVGGALCLGPDLSLSPTSAPCEQRESVRRLRHSLGCFSTLVPWADKPPSPMQPLGLRAPHPANPNNPASWYSGLCPCLTGTVSTSTSLFRTHPLISTRMSPAWLLVCLMLKALRSLLNFTFVCRNSCWFLF